MKEANRTILGLFVGLVLVWFLFRKTDWPMVLTLIKDIDIRWVLLSQAFSWSTHFARAQRWSYVVRAGHDVSYRQLLSATQIGFLVNFTIPARIGEGVRAYVLHRLARFPVTKCLAMVALDRVSDVFALLATLLLVMLVFPVEGDIEIPAGYINNAETIAIPATFVTTATTSCSILLAALLLLLSFLYFNQGLVIRLLHATVGRLSMRLSNRLEKTFTNFAAGMHIFRSANHLLKSAFFSLLTWGGGILSLHCMLHAFHLQLPWPTPIVIMAMIAVFITVPVTPGIIGQFHLAIIAGLVIISPETAPDTAKAFAIVVHALGLIPVGVLGFYCLHREGMSFTGLIRKSKKTSEEPAKG